MKSLKVVGVVLMSIGLWLVAIGLYSQSSVACDNTLNTVARNYNACKTGLQRDVAQTLLPLIAKRDALKKRVDELTALLANYEREKDRLTKSIEALRKEVKEKGCINCIPHVNPIVVDDPRGHSGGSGNQSNNRGGGNNNSSTCGKDKDKEPSCRLPNICGICSGLIHQSSGKPLCEVCGCNCR